MASSNEKRRTALARSVDDLERVVRRLQREGFMTRADALRGQIVRLEAEIDEINRLRNPRNA